MSRLAALSAADWPNGDPECTLLSQVRDGRDSQGTSKKRHYVGEG